MKRLGAILAIALGLVSIDASAQWYIFPDFSKKGKDTLSVKVKQPVDTIVVVPVSEITAPAEPAPYEPETLFPEEASLDTADAQEFVVDIPGTVNVGLLLPFESKGRMNPSMMEFYCGALLAARELGTEGVSMNLNVYDCSPGKAGISDWEFLNTDVLIGPVTYSDVADQLDIHPEGKYFISPLDAQVAQLATDHPVIQASSGQENQVSEMLNWLSRELEPADKVVIVEESGVQRTEYSQKVFDGLDSMGVAYDNITYGILQGLKIGGQFLDKSSRDGATRFIIASENESFVGDAIRNMALLQHKGRQVALYGISKLRSYQSIEADDLHAVNLRLAATFYADYSSPEVKSFVLAYRSLFNAEPGSFAFNGYDVTRFFTSLCANIGRNWGQVIDDYFGKGLYSDFYFVRAENSVGASSTGVRLLVYNPDFTITFTN